MIETTCKAAHRDESSWLFRLHGTPVWFIRKHYVNSIEKKQTKSCRYYENPSFHYFWSLTNVWDHQLTYRTFSRPFFHSHTHDCHFTCYGFVSMATSHFTKQHINCLGPKHHSTIMFTAPVQPPHLKERGTAKASSNSGSLLLMVQKSHSQPPGMVLKPYK